MGASDSKLVFKQGIFKLSEAGSINPSDPYWKGFYELPQSTEDVFSLFSPADIRRARDSALDNLETLIRTLASRLSTLRKTPSFPNTEQCPSRHALNCIRVLTRVIPFLFEADHLETWRNRFLWERQVDQDTADEREKAEILFDEDHDVKPQLQEKTQSRRKKPLGEELIDTLVDLLFYVDFTIPPNFRTKNRVTYSIWETGVGCATPTESIKSLESNRAEVLRLLLTLCSEALYMPPSVLPIQGVKAVTHLVTCTDKQMVLSVLCSLLNTTMNYNSSIWRVPYDQLVVKDPKQALVSYSLELLLFLLLYPVPELGTSTPPKNYFRVFLGRLHRPQDFEFLVDGLLKFLNQPINATSTILQGTQQAHRWAPELIMLFWEALQCNKRFRSFIIGSDYGHKFLVLILYYGLEYKSDPTKQGVVRMCAFVLQTLSTEIDFGKRLNEPYENQGSLPPAARVENFEGTYGDFVILSIHTLITSTKGKLDAIYPSLLATINNIAPYLRNLSTESSKRLLSLFSSMSMPSFLLANETNHLSVISLLESLNAIIEHQYVQNSNLVRAIFKSKKSFESLRSFTLEGGQEELQRQARLRKEEVNDPMAPVDPRHGSFDGNRSPHSVRSPSLSNVPEDSDAFAIGDDEDDENDESPTAEMPSHSSPSGRATSSRASSVDESVPAQVRGMSEKARGKMPMNQKSFSRQNSSTNLMRQSTSGSTPGGNFEPTPDWIESWLPSLPLHTMLTLLDQAPIPDSLPSSIEPTPPRLHLFEWTPLALGWYESLLWGFIFANESMAQKGTVGVWNGTNIRLFRVERGVKQGPSLRQPMGAVDAVGSNLVQRIGSLTMKGKEATTQRVGDV